jgi:hypothetical protein
MVMQMQSWDRLQKLKATDKDEYSKMDHLHTINPLLHKAPKEKRKIESTLKKYFRPDAKQTVI